MEAQFPNYSCRKTKDPDSLCRDLQLICGMIILLELRQLELLLQERPEFLPLCAQPGYGLLHGPLFSCEQSLPDAS